MYRIELTTREGEDLPDVIAGADDTYSTAEAALAAVLPPVQDYARLMQHALWLRIRDADARPVFGTLVP